MSASNITTWEIAVLTHRDRLELTMPADSWIAHVEVLPWLSFVPVDNRIALRSVHLEGFSRAHRLGLNRQVIARAPRLMNPQMMSASPTITMR